ncbi:MAG: ABC transporter ATP-binding protein [Hyphomicrobiales bacterium]|nr:ABC transporter ATP-binding protein [Hyphomicrobiales bacterium]
MLEVEDLRVAYPRRGGGLQEVVRGVSFSLGRERLGIVGESGSGKSQTGRAILGLTAPGGQVSARTLRLDGVDLLHCSASQRRALRGRRISMVLQDPKFSLNPVATVGRQIAEAYRVHQKASAREARERTLAMLEAVQIREPQRVYDLYPHEVSGGMGQRVMIAMMLIAEPDVLIADEPTSALDVTVQLEILRILDDLVTKRGMGLIFISHDLHLVRSFCDRVIVMYAGKAMETLPAAELADPTAMARRHPYTLGLLDCLPDLERPKAKLATLTRDPEWAR